MTELATATRMVDKLRAERDSLKAINAELVETLGTIKTLAHNLPHTATAAKIEMLAHDTFVKYAKATTDDA